MKTCVTVFLILYIGVFPPGVSVAADDTPQIIPVQELIDALGCKGCHMINGGGGSLAADLTKIGNRLTAKQIEAQLVADPATRVQGFMPSYKTLPENDLQRISDYLYNLH